LYNVIITYGKGKGEKILRELRVGINDHDQRIDRFLGKYLNKAPNTFIFKMLRKKNIKLNGKRADPKDKIYEGDIINLYLADETIDKFREVDRVESDLIPNIVYEDDNIILINKEVGVLSHAANQDYGNNIVDSMVSYLYKKGDYNPRLEKTFTPSICNRLDRNTSGMIIGGKTYLALRAMNDGIKEARVHRYYRTIVKGKLDKNGTIEGYLTKDGDLNKVEITSREKEESKKIITRIRTIRSSEEYSLVEIELITGRTHQIRAHLSFIGHPVIGDLKYGDKGTNKYFKDNYRLNSQLLHSYKVGFDYLNEPLEYLSGKEFIADSSSLFKKIERDLF